MQLEAIRRGRRILSAAVSLSAIALCMAKLGSDESSTGVGLAASASFFVSCLLLIVVWRMEHVASQAAFAERERAALALFRVQLELTKQKAAGDAARPPP